MISARHAANSGDGYSTARHAYSDTQTTLISLLLSATKRTITASKFRISWIVCRLRIDFTEKILNVSRIWKHDKKIGVYTTGLTCA